jgi:type I restriction enzyme S subunit
MVTAKDIHDGQIDYKSARLTSKEAYETLLTDKSRPRVGDILLTKDGSIGRVAICDRADVCINQSVALLQPNSLVDSRFLAYLLQAPFYQDRMAADADGSTIKHIYITRVDKMPLDLPPLIEQRAIARFLGSLDDNIATNNRLRSLVDDLVGAKFKLMSAGRDAAQLADIADVNLVVTKPRPGSSLRYVDIASVRQGDYDYPDLSLWDDAPSRARRVVMAGDTIWSTVRPNRRSHALVLDDDPLLVASTGLAVITPKAGRIAGLFESTRTDAFGGYLQSVAEGSAYPAVRVDRFLSAPVPNLSAEMWDAFERFALPLRRRGHAAVVESRHLSAARDELLPLLMSGKLHVKDVEKITEEIR